MKKIVLSVVMLMGTCGLEAFFASTMVRALTIEKSNCFRFNVAVLKYLLDKLDESICHHDRFDFYLEQSADYYNRIMTILDLPLIDRIKTTSEDRKTVQDPEDEYLKRQQMVKNLRVKVASLDRLLETYNNHNN